MKFSKIFLVVATVIILPHKKASAFSVNTPQSDRRNFLEQVGTATFGALLLQPSAPALAADDEVALPTREVVTSTFAPIKYELNDPNGGVAYLQGRIDAKDFAGVLEFTKSYDLEFRKLRMGRAKKLLQSKEIKEKATGFCNAVTFDLIGINRSSRSGQESAESASKYLQELRDDVSKFLELEASIEVEG